MPEENITIVIWCSGCNAEPAVDSIEIQMQDKWEQLDLGEECLTTLREGGRL